MRRLMWGLLLSLALFGCGQPEPAPEPQAPAVPEGLAEAPLEALSENPEPAWALARAAKIGLSEAQRKTVQAAQTAFEAETKDDRAAMETASADFIAYLEGNAEQVDPAEVERRDEASRAVNERLMKARSKHWAKVWEALTEEQRAKVDSLRIDDPFALR